MNLSLDAGLLTTLIVLFSTGIVSGLSPCTLPTVIFVTAYVSGKTANAEDNHKANKLNGFSLSLSFVLGIVFILAALGLLAGFAGSLFAEESYLYYIMAGFLIIMGLWMLKAYELPSEISMFQRINPGKGSGHLGAFMLGLPFGLTASPCTLPLTASILAYAAVRGDALTGALFLLVFSVGRSLPLLVVGSFSGLIKKINKLSSFQNKIEYISGTVLVVLGLYYIWIA